MRPLKLKIQALGPFSRELVLDFKELSGNSFFLIHGPTGSGKTTILDAICFALYGETSGDERGIRDMRSHHVDEATNTEVSLDFSLGGQIFRLNRCPEQTRPKMRGEGFTKVPARAELWKRTGLSDDDRDGTLLADRWSGVNQKIEELLGFKSDQFRQVIMLPQGRFREFLLADSRQRQEILEMLFQTEIYRRIEEELKKAAGETEKSIKEQQNLRRLILDQSGVEAEAELRVQKEENSQNLILIQKSLADLRRAEEEAQAGLRRAEKEIQLIGEKEEAEKRFLDLKKQEPFIDRKKESRERALRAGPVTNAENLRDQRHKEMIEAETRLKKTEQAVGTARISREKAARNLAGEEARGNERQKAAQRVIELDNLRPLVSALARLNQDKEQSRREEIQKTGEYKKVRQDLTGVQNQLTQTLTLQTRTMRLSDRREGFRLEDNRLRDFCQQRRQLETLKIDLQKAERLSASASGRAARISELLDQARGDHENAEKAWMEGQAGLLARTLSPGWPCPVCGSPDHPAPAFSLTMAPDEAALKKKRLEISRMEKDRETAREAESKARQEVRTLENRIALLIQGLGPWAGRELRELEEEAALKARDLAEAEAARARLTPLEKEIEELKKQEAWLTENLTRLETACREAGQKLARAETILLEREAAVPVALRPPKALDQARDLAAKMLEDLNKSLEMARRLDLLAAENLAAGESASKGAGEGFLEASRRLAVQEKELVAALKQAGFTDEKDFLAARLTDREIKNLETEINRFASSLQAARERLDRAEAAARNIKPPDIEAVRNKAGQAKAALEKAIQEETRLAEQKNRLERRLEQLERAGKKLEKLEAHYSIVGALSEVANGKNPRFLTFQRFVLAALLDDVLLAATARLQIMSGGRYIMEREPEGQRRRSPWGLDLRVFDHYTGQARPVATLSGGESFLAALALALGLADVVQAHSGGIHLDTIFVDEGFGSLDPEALDLALRALFDLRRGGRLVGLISHVPELKERISARLEVTPGRNGSTARFVV